MTAADRDRLQALFAQHPRRWQDFRYVYPVISRRSRGLSIGVNLNPDGVCNFDCRYCCVDRAALARDPATESAVDMPRLREELRTMLAWAVGGEIWNQPPFDHTPPDYRHVRDIAFSGNGEPTACQRFGEACDLVVELKGAMGLADVRVVVITNATLLDRPAVQQALDKLAAHGGEIWAKLDAGTQDYYDRINRSSVSLEKVTGAILHAGRRHPLVIQSMFVALDGQAMSDAELQAYTQRLRRLVDEGCRVRLVQVYTLARATPEAGVAPVANQRLQQIASAVRAALATVPVDVFGGPA